jgi:hypothetical protein
MCEITPKKSSLMRFAADDFIFIHSIHSFDSFSLILGGASQACHSSYVSIGGMKPLKNSTSEAVSAQPLVLAREYCQIIFLLTVSINKRLHFILSWNSIVECSWLIQQYTMVSTWRPDSRYPLCK